MQPTQGDVHVNTPLTNLSIAFLQNANNFIASRVFPNVPVQKRSDRYFTYDRGQFNRDEMQLRAAGAESAGGGYDIDSTPTYYCQKYALHKDIDDDTRANADAALNLDREAMAWLSHKALIKREKAWVGSYFNAGAWSFGRAGVASNPAVGTSVLKWSDPASTPIEDVRNAKRIVLESTGYEPNKLTLGKAVYDILLDHPDIIDRLKYGQTAGSPAMANRERLAQLFEVDEILVSSAIENTSQEGLANVHSFIMGKGALLTYSPAAAGLMTPSAGYTFSWTGRYGNGAEGNRVKSYRMENLDSDRVEIEICFDMKKVAADLGFFFDAIVA
jgi:hypothetical protein